MNWHVVGNTVTNGTTTYTAETAADAETLLVSLQDHQRFVHISNAERTVATNKWLVAVYFGKTTEYAYFSTENLTNSTNVGKLYPNRLEALRAAVDMASGDHGNG